MTQTPPATAALTVLGPGRVGRAIARAGRAGGLPVELLGRDADLDRLDGADLLLCVPDAAIGEAAAAVGASGATPRSIGHVSGATPLSALDAAGPTELGSFSIHPLQTVPDGDADLAGAWCAVGGVTAEATAFAVEAASRLGMRPFQLDEPDRGAYHAAACIASNFLITLEQLAAELLGRAGVEEPRQALAPLVLRTAGNWAADGGAALTGPIARGDEATIAAHRDGLSELAPELLDLYDLLAARTREIAAEAPGGSGVRPDRGPEP